MHLVFVVFFDQHKKLHPMIIHGKFLFDWHWGFQDNFVWNFHMVRCQTMLYCAGYLDWKLVDVESWNNDLIGGTFGSFSNKPLFQLNYGAGHFIRTPKNGKTTPYYKKILCFLRKLQMDSNQIPLLISIEFNVCISTINSLYSDIGGLQTMFLGALSARTSQQADNVGLLKTLSFELFPYTRHVATFNT